MTQKRPFISIGLLLSGFTGSSVLKVVLNEIPEENTLCIESFEKAERLNKLFKDEVEVYSFSSPVKASFNVSRKSETVFVELFISGSLVVSCSRCLTEFQHTIKYSNLLILFPREEYRERVIIESDEIDKFFYDNDTLDLGELFRDEIVLTLPTTFFCSDECKGLCHNCGQNLNQANCLCKTSSIDERFNMLRKLKFNA